MLQIFIWKKHFAHCILANVYAFTLLIENFRVQLEMASQNSVNIDYDKEGEDNFFCH